MGLRRLARERAVQILYAIDRTQQPLTDAIVAFLELQEGRQRKFVNAVEQVTFSGRMGRQRGQRVTYVTERCVIDLTGDGLVVRELAPGVDLQRDVIGQAECALRAAPDLRTMDERLFRDTPLGLRLAEKTRA